MVLSMHLCAAAGRRRFVLGRVCWGGALTGRLGSLAPRVLSKAVQVYRSLFLSASHSSVTVTVPSFMPSVAGSLKLDLVITLLQSQNVLHVLLLRTAWS